MSDEFEDISVVETEPVESGAPVDASAEAVPPEVTPPEVTPAEVAATKVNLDAGDEALKQNSQTAYLEANAPDRVNESGAAVTLAGIAAKEADKEEKRAQAFEHSQEEIKRSEARRDFMNKEHDFGDMKMSGADLEKLMNFMSNPQMQDKLRERLGKSGMPKEKVDKGMMELNEYAELKKKEKDGTLSEDQQRRLKEINKSEEFKVVAQEAAAYAYQQGLEINVKGKEAAIKAEAQVVGLVNGKADSVVAARIADQEKSQSSVSWSAASSRDELPKTVELTSLYNDKSVGTVPANTQEPAKPQIVANAVSAAKIEASNMALM